MSDATLAAKIKATSDDQQQYFLVISYMHMATKYLPLRYQLSIQQHLVFCCDIHHAYGDPNSSIALSVEHITTQLLALRYLLSIQRRSIFRCTTLYVYSDANSRCDLLPKYCDAYYFIVISSDPIATTQVVFIGSRTPTREGVNMRFKN